MTDTVTPWSTVTPYATDLPIWAGIEASERLAAYTAYQNMYWSEDGCLELIRRNEDGRPIYIPRPKMIVDTTAHYLLKGMKLSTPDDEKNVELAAEMKRFVLRERFYSKFQVAKLAGVTRGDWLFHFTANPLKDEGTRISVNSIDPAIYFPEFDTDDLEKRTGVKLVEQMQDPDDPNKTVVHILRYWQEYKDGQRTSSLVWREENLWELEGWNNPKKAKKLKSLIPASPLPLDITSIPIYHFKNAEWDGFEFGNSELKGVERLFQGIDQAVSDVEISLALVGLGVYATDAGRPRDSQGKETDWIVAPGTVWEMPGATMVKRLEGISSVTPVLDHVGYLDAALLSATGTSQAALGEVDVATAESGIALALKFIPTLAKIEYRDTAGVEILTQMWYDWKFWLKAYESIDFTETEIQITLGDKLPINAKGVIEELNNLLDRKIISRKYYRQQIVLKLGYQIPDGMEQEVIDEQVEMNRALMEVQQEQMAAAEGGTDQPENRDAANRRVGSGDTIPPSDRNRSNNRERTNESNGTEA